MLVELSHSTAIVGFSSGRNSSTHSGWLRHKRHERNQRQPQQFQQPCDRE